MATITFNTLQASRNLQNAGFDNAQAEAVVDTLAEAFSDTVATQADIVDLKAELKTDIAATQADIARLEVCLTRQLYAVAANAGLTFGLLKLVSP